MISLVCTIIRIVLMSFRHLNSDRLVADNTHVVVRTNNRILAARKYSLSPISWIPTEDEIKERNC